MLPIGWVLQCLEGAALMDGTTDASIDLQAESSLDDRLSPEAHACLDEARRVISDLGSVVVGLSGGVDSSLLAKLCVDTLGTDRSLAVIAQSPSLPARELGSAVEVANDIGIAWEVIDTQELEDERYAANPTNRCYFCRDELFGQLTDVAQRRGFAAIAYGEIADDLGDHRPGRTAAREHEVRAPLREAGATKPIVRELARYFDLTVWDKPAMACLASRIPYGDPVTAEKLDQIDRAERTLEELGFRNYRVRHHGDVARLEVDPADFHRMVEEAETIVAQIQTVGFRFVALDLAGYRSGSLNVSVGQPLPLA